MEAPEKMPEAEGEMAPRVCAAVPGRRPWSGHSAFRIPHSAFGARGFTFLEVIVVLVLVGVAAAVAVPPLGAGLRHWRLQGAVQEVRTLFTYARNEAVARRLPLQVVVDRARSIYWLDAIDPAVLEDPARDEHPKVRRYALPAGMRFGEATVGGGAPAGERFGVPFYPRGTSPGGQIQILDDRQRSYRITIHPLTGQARVERG